MRYFYAILFFLTLINFSGVPELLSVVLGEEHPYCVLLEEEAGEEDQQEKSKEEDSKEKEKEDVKKSLLAESALLHGSAITAGLLGHNRNSMICGYEAEDHCPPPEAA